MYETGRGFTQDCFKAVKWYRTAAIGLDSYLGAVAAVFHRAGGQISYAKNA
jgi:TPR repeat protein